ncbi:DUF6968 family protein [Humitalea rosea]|uniref:DUF6968 family protein n=1 Tax=Humitalea rosea TaxID=990373 RepID=UPI0011B50800|nr:hypothetical protein [Humitalea rosea]
MSNFGDHPAFEVIATRTLDVNGEPAFHLRIGRPVLEADGETWRCDYSVEGPSTNHRSSFCGVDAVQALLNVIYVMSVEAEMSEENLSGRLTWGGQRGHFGLPAPEADPERKQSAHDRT